MADPNAVAAGASIDWQSVAIGLLSIVSVGLGWFARQMWDAVQQLRRDLGELEVVVSRDYVSYERLKDAMSPIMTVLEDIKRTLHDKVDKT